MGGVYRMPAVGGLVPPVPLVAAARTDAWPAGGGWVVEPKFDGWLY
jgi:hypothetical protein